MTDRSLRDRLEEAQVEARRLRARLADPADAARTQSAVLAEVKETRERVVALRTSIEAAREAEEESRLAALREKFALAESQGHGRALGQAVLAVVLAGGAGALAHLVTDAFSVVPASVTWGIAAATGGWLCRELYAVGRTVSSRRRKE